MIGNQNTCTKPAIVEMVSASPSNIYNIEEIPRRVQKRLIPTDSPLTGGVVAAWSSQSSYGLTSVSVDMANYQVVNARIRPDDEDNFEEEPSVDFSEMFPETFVVPGLVFTQPMRLQAFRDIFDDD